MKYLGLMYKEGNHVVELNMELAEKYFRMGADLGNNNCQSELGELLYEEGKKDEAFIWLVKSAEQGNREAAYLVGQMCEFGDEIPADMEQAIKWYITSAMQTYDDDAKKALEALDRILKKSLNE